MFIRVKKNGSHEYLQLVSSERVDGKVRQRVIGTLGRRDLLEQSGALDGLAASLGKFARHTALLTLGQRGHSKDHRPDLKQMVVGVVLSGEGWPGSYHQVHGARESAKDPSPLKVKDVRFTGADGRDRRYVVCHNEEQARKDCKDREAIVASLEDQLKRGDKSLVGNKGYRKYIQSGGKHFGIDREKIKAEARLDGKWVLRTNWEGSAAEVALRYKELWMVEAIFRTMKSVLETRPICHQRDETIRGHVFCSFLALVLRKELQERLAARGLELEWADVLGDLNALGVTTVRAGAAVCELRSLPRGVAGQVLQAAGVALGPPLRFLDEQEAAAWEGNCSATGCLQIRN